MGVFLCSDRSIDNAFFQRNSPTYQIFNVGQIWSSARS